MFSGLNASALFGRLSQFFETADPVVVMLGLTTLFALLLMALFGRRLELFFLLVLASSFTGSVWKTLDSGSTLLRWYLIGILALTVVRVRVRPGPALVMFVMYLLVGLCMTVFSPDPFYSIQSGVIALALACTIWVLGDYAKDQCAVARLCSAVALVGVVWAALALGTAGAVIQNTETGRRWSGATGAAGIFVQTGGLILPFCLWMAMRPGRRFRRLFFSGLVTAMAIALVASGQRTGAFGGFICCLPLLASRRLGRIFAAATGLGIVGLLLIQLAQISPGQAEFVIRRYQGGTTERAETWIATMPRLMESPILGRGLGSNIEAAQFAGHTLHNMYLMVWWDAGIFGLLFLLGAMAVAGWYALRLAFGSKDPNLVQLGRLMLGLLLGVAAMGMFTPAAQSPSDLATTTLLLAFVLTYRLRVMPQEAAATGTQLAYIYFPGTYGVPASTPQEMPPGRYVYR